MTTRVGINGFGRMGRLALRAGFDRDDMEFVAINEPEGTAESLSILAEFDSVQGRWDHACGFDGEDALTIDGKRLALTREIDPIHVPWRASEVDMVLECSGRFRNTPALLGHLEQGASRVIVSAPVKDGLPNIVVGVNDGDFDYSQEPLVTAASCTTNALAPIVRTLHDTLGIERGVVTTIHDPTNTQAVHDSPHADPRRGRASMLNLVPTSTNSATAVTMIVPELVGRLDSIAIRVPVMNASIVDAVFHVSRNTSIEDVNGILRTATESGPLQGILGFEERPLVSSDYAGDPRSSVIDAASTRVTDNRLVKILAWYDNEWGYANRLIELAAMACATTLTTER
jgi:glyceraldehyde 3-phosphate dehydrogenase